MIRTFIVWSCVAASAIATAQPAHGWALTGESGEYVVVTPIWGHYLAQPEQEAPFDVNYWQFMVIGGVPTIVLVSTVYTTGRKKLSLEETWNGYNVYGLGDCEC